jgi:UDP-N-acetylmuramate dehydrogenase
MNAVSKVESAGLAEMAEKAWRGELRLSEPMARHTTWRAGGAVDRAYFPADLADLRQFIGGLDPGEPLCMVGLGSNLLVRDGGLRGTVIFTHEALNEVTLEPGGEIRAEAGVASPKVARFAAMHDRTGAEFLAGVPGTVGGALAMNAGCYGGETWEIVARVTTVDRRGEVHEHTRDDYEIAYRSVRRKGKEVSDEWFLSATFRLPSGDGGLSRRKMRDLLARRIATQPLSQPNAGSVFRNPPGDFAARLIEACGLKGHAIGGAQISGKHANFIVHGGSARAADIEALIELAQRTVREKFGVALEREVRIVGEK